jgi:hypothetical protein
MNKEGASYSRKLTVFIRTSPRTFLPYNLEKHNLRNQVTLCAYVFQQKIGQVALVLDFCAR